MRMKVNIYLIATFHQNSGLELYCTC